jgi:polar amino acid transport system substrate-binding protein
VKPRFQQGQWDRLPLLLGRAADCVINGIELTPERLRDYSCSRPYFAYSLQLLARRDGPVDAFHTLAAPGPEGRWRVGVLTGSAAESVMRSRSDLEVDVIGYDGTIDSLEQVSTGVLDAAVMDDCIFTFYADRFRRLRTVERPFEGGFYTILTARDTPQLSAAIDAAIGRLIADGRLKALYDRWDLAGRQQMLLLRDATEIPVARRKSLGELCRDTLPLLLKAAGMTILLSCLAFPLAVGIGVSCRFTSSGL